MPHKIERLCSVTSTYTVGTDPSAAPKIPFGAAAGGIIIVDSVDEGSDTLNWHVAFGPEDPLVGVGSGLQTDITPGNAYPVPDALFAAPFISAVTNNGTVTFRMCVKG